MLDAAGVAQRQWAATRAREGLAAAAGRTRMRVTRKPLTAGFGSGRARPEDDRAGLELRSGGGPRPG